MIAYIVLILAALSRLIPHALHGTGLNFTAVGAGLLFFGSRRPRWQAWPPSPSSPRPTST